MSNENAYRKAIGLIDAIEYVCRFEQKERILQSAIDKLDKLGDYKDAENIAKDCRRLRDQEIENGTAAVMKKAAARHSAAETKSDYADAIENYKRVMKYGYKVDECKKCIADCEKKIGRIETGLLWKRRFTALAVIAVIAGIVRVTPIYPALKGVVHQKRGEYTAAINCYRSIGGGLGTSKQMKKCYFYLGEEAYKEGKIKKALKLYKKAENKLDAPERACEIEKQMMAEAEVKDSVTFGYSKWTVLERREDGTLLLFCEELVSKMAYDTEGSAGSYVESSLCRKLNKQYLNNHFSTFEQEMMVEQDVMQIPESEQEFDTESGEKITEMPVYFTLLSEKQYHDDSVSSHIKKLYIRGKHYWLSDCKNGEAFCVMPSEAGMDVNVFDEKDDDKYARPLCVVSLSQSSAE